MRVPLESGDRKLLIIAGALLVLAVLGAVVVSPPKVEPMRGVPSRYSTASKGAKAAYLLLRELGIETESWESPPSDLPRAPEEAAKVVLILAEPITFPSAEEESDLRSFLTAGGQILATGIAGAALVPEGDLRPGKNPLPEPRRFRAELPAPLTRRTPEVMLEAPTRWGQGHGHHVRYYGDARGATVVSYRVGRGRVVWWADATPLTNYG
ncbi:MAG: DUF4350 domain-containing protein, partial [Anaerolineales bacterium]